MNCFACNAPATIHITTINGNNKTEEHWCIDHSPPELEKTNIKHRAWDAWYEARTTYIESLPPNERPSWRVHAFSAFLQGWRRKGAEDEEESVAAALQRLETTIESKTLAEAGEADTLPALEDDPHAD